MFGVMNEDNMYRLNLGSYSGITFENTALQVVKKAQSIILYLLLFPQGITLKQLWAYDRIIWVLLVQTRALLQMDGCSFLDFIS